MFAFLGTLYELVGVPSREAPRLTPSLGYVAGDRFRTPDNLQSLCGVTNPGQSRNAPFSLAYPLRCEVFRARERMFGMRGDDRDAALCSYADRGWPPAAIPLMPGCSREVYPAE